MIHTLPHLFARLGDVGSNSAAEQISLPTTDEQRPRETVKLKRADHPISFGPTGPLAERPDLIRVPPRATPIPEQYIGS
jgi:hypothetical protein